MPYSLKLLLFSLLTTSACLVILPLAPFDRDGILAYRISRFWAWGILKLCGIRLVVQGLEGLDPNRQYIFIANHQSYIDIPVLVQALSQFQLRWIAKKELFWVPLFGWVLWSSKHIIVDRSSLSRAMNSLSRARERIEKGISVVVFPEGTRSRHGDLLPFKRGGFLLAFKSQTPIVPVTIKGSGVVWSRGDWRIRSGEIAIVMGKPVSVDRYRAQDLKLLVNRVRAEIESHSHPQTDSLSNRSNSFRTPAQHRPG
ncbi:MAG: lysophospholipid acyltransferase family protein [Deltaproteobacteria bacterium]|nr:lysophospholipid acyltransferase family protein [Deltaproteobacteria bacterium]MCZ6547478.1 lysophospholipid acyltransferase family protein [Deltaproteobacteria bacterium]MCZ6562655.1 lysophospholipid acyltransferase family protein [Deltaproteobacteria bacterium]MCZ6907326.1 lysophospholipid acyltransferase family protein [Deltaproteobacteria bacterium]